MSHDISLAVWDLTSPVAVGRRPTLKVGVSCTSACDLSATRVDVYDHAGRHVATATLGSEPWPATTALYWAELDLVAPEREGDVSLEIRATPTPPHADATSVATFVVIGQPEHRVTLHVIDKTSGAPVAGVELRLGGFRAATDEAGIAHLKVPRGNYEVGTWKIRYEIVSKTVHIADDTTIHFELTPQPEPEQPYWM